MYSETSRIFFLCAVLFIANTHAIPKSNPSSICNSDEVGIGSSEKLYTTGGVDNFQGEGFHGAIYAPNAPNCEILDLSSNPTPFEDGWDNYFHVTSTDKGDPATGVPGTFPLEVRTPNGIYKNCRSVGADRGCDTGGEKNRRLSSVTHCCKYSCPNNEVQKRRVEATTICKPKEVGVGRIHIDQQSQESSIKGHGFQGAIFAPDCQILALSRYITPWTGGWRQYFNVFSTGSGFYRSPTEVRTPDGIYQKCMPLPTASNCDGSGHDYFLEAPVTHCCKYIKPNPDVPQKAASIDDIENDGPEIDSMITEPVDVDT